MERRYEGFMAPHGLYVLDTHSGEVRFIPHGDNTLPNVSAVEKDVQIGSFGPAAPSPKHPLSPFESEVISSYPYLISKPFADLQREGDARMRCKLMVDTFTALLKYMALQLASEYIRAKDVKDIQVHQTLTKDLSRPLISVWNQLIARCLPVLKDHNIPLFTPEMKEAYEKLETRCREPFLVTQSYSDENGEIRTRTKKLGKIQALIHYRNGLAHGFNQSQTRAQKEFDEYYPLLCDILQEVRFISRYTLWHVESGRQGVNGIRLMGANPSKRKVDFDMEGVNPSVSPLFLINDATREILPLYAFFDVDDANENGLPEIGKDVFVFEGNTKSTLIYISTSGEHLEKSSRFRHWKDLLAQKQLEVEWADVKNLSLDMLKAIGTHISSTGIQALIQSGKYLREATIPRRDLNELLESFSDGAFNGFVLGGESGIGKSTLLAQKTEEWQAAGHMVAFYRGSALSQSDIANKFLRDCALKVGYLEDFLTLADPLFSGSDKKCYLIVDGLNEYAGDLNELIKSADNTVAQASNFPWFKLIVSIRDSVYSRATARFGELSAHNYFSVDDEKTGEVIRTNIIRLQPVAKDFVAGLYDAYRAFKWKEGSEPEAEGYYAFRPLTAFSDLNPDGSTVQLLRNPLMARLVMQSFHRAKLPSQLSNDDAMRLYHDNIVLEKSEGSLGFPERKKFLSTLVAEMDRQDTDRIERDQLLRNPMLRSHLMNTHRDSAYIQLLDLGVLMEEWEGEDCQVRFSFDKFLEYLLAEYHWPKINDAESLMALCKRAVRFKMLQGAVEVIIIRFCLNHQSQHLVALIDMADIESDTLKGLVTDISVRLMFALCSEYPSIFNALIDEFPKQPGELDLLILKELLDKMYLTGHLEAFEKTMAIAIREAHILENHKALSDIMLNSAQYDLLQGRYTDARNKLQQIIAIKSELNDAYGRNIGLRKLGVLEWREGNMAKSMQIYEECLLETKSLGFDDLTASLLNNLGVLKKHFGNNLEAEKLYLETLEIKRKIGDKKGIGITLNNLGVLYKKQGRVQEAEALYLESLDIRKQLGDKQGISTSLLNLGIIYNAQGRIQEAESLYLESLKIKRTLADKKGISITLIHIGDLFKDQARKDEAESHYQESLLIRRELGDKTGIVKSLNSLANLYGEQGRTREAESLYLESIEISRHLGVIAETSESMSKLANVYVQIGRMDEVEKLLLGSLDIDRQLGDEKRVCQSLNQLGDFYKEQGRSQEAERLYQEAKDISSV